MKTVQYAYLCERCGHCKLTLFCQSAVKMTCPSCLRWTKFVLSSVVTDRGEYEEWERI